MKILRLTFLLCLLSLPLPLFCYQYTITSLAKDFGIIEMNNTGQVIGNMKLGDGSLQPFIYQNGTYTNFRSVCNGADVDMADINDSGVIVGTLIHEAPEGCCPRYTAFVWRPGTGLTDLDSVQPNGLSRAIAINNNGCVIGETEDATGFKAYIWSGAEGMQVIPTFGGNYSEAYDINNNDQVLGSAQNASADWSPFTYDTSGIVNLASLGVTGTVSAINDSGQICGRLCEPLPAAWPHGFLWDETRGTMIISADSFGQYYYCNGLSDINNSGIAVGNYYNWSTSETGSLVYINGQVKMIEDLLPNGNGWTQISACCINDIGQIAGTGRYNGETRGFIMNPVPEPSSLFCIISGLAFLGILKQRRSS